MPIATEFELTFGCGHVGSLDLSGLAPDRRGGRIAYLQDKGLCGDCFEATRQMRRELDRRSRVTAWRKEEEAEASVWAARDGYAPLAGNAKQAAFANGVRYDLMRRLYEWAVQDGNDPAGYARVEATAKTVDTTRWWLDQRGLVGEPADLLELLDAAAETHAGQNCEKPA